MVEGMDKDVKGSFSHCLALASLHANNGTLKHKEGRLEALALIYDEVIPHLLHGHKTDITQDLPVHHDEGTYS
jgi:hypothetical protein